MRSSSGSAAGCVSHERDVLPGELLGLELALADAFRLDHDHAVGRGDHAVWLHDDLLLVAGPARTELEFLGQQRELSGLNLISDPGESLGLPCATRSTAPRNACRGRKSKASSTSAVRTFS